MMRPDRFVRKTRMEQDRPLFQRIPRMLGAVAAGVAVAGILWLFHLATLWLTLTAIAATALVGLAPFSRRQMPASARSTTDDEALPAVPPIAREIFENLPDALMLLDRSGRVLFANSAMQNISGADAEGKHVSAVLRTPVVLEAIQQAGSTGAPATVQFGLPVPVERHFEAHALRTGQSGLTALVLHELTSLKRSEQMRVDFVANASHELRTPLAAVTGFIDTLRGHARDDAGAREQFLAIMSAEADRMRRLIDDLLSLSRIELNEHVPPQGEIALDSVAGEAVAALRPLAKAENIAIAIEAASDLPVVTGERDELVQLFQNLIHNAIKYGRPGGHVWISLARAASLTRAGEGAVAATIRDDGEGIPAEAIPRLTERFYRVDVQRSREKGGTGLGLAIVKHIVNRHHGRLSIESRAGEGSTFTVILPAARTPVLAAAQ